MVRCHHLSGMSLAFDAICARDLQLLRFSVRLEKIQNIAIAFILHIDDFTHQRPHVIQYHATRILYIPVCGGDDDADYKDQQGHKSVLDVARTVTTGEVEHLV